MFIGDGAIYQAMESHRDPLAMTIMHHFSDINPHVILKQTEFCFDGESKYRHSKDLKEWLLLTCAIGSIYRQSVTVRIDGPSKSITLVTDVVTNKESDTECSLQLPESHPEVEKDKPQYPVGKLVNVSEMYHALRFNKDRDAHSYIGRFSTFSHAIDRLEYANDQLQIKPTVDVFDFYI